MYKAYCIDDEPLVLEDFMNNPLFADSGFILAGCQTNPVKAAKEIRKICPDVVFTDLKMPTMNGVELTEKLRGEGISCEFVVISAYPEFDESRRFFLLDGFDYLLKPVSDQDLSQLLSRLAAKLARKKPTQYYPTEKLPPRLNKIIAYLAADIAAQHSINSLCEEFHINRSLLNRLFLQHLGTSPIAYLTTLRMERAAHLLDESPLDIKEIALQCGYKDYFYFCRVFRNHYLCTPTAYREG